MNAEVSDFADTAAVIAQLDLVITVDASVAHLAGSLGKPVWILLSNRPDWRWGRAGGSTPWYPASRLFRQSADGAWEPVVAAVDAALQMLVARRPKHEKAIGRGYRRHHAQLHHPCVSPRDDRRGACSRLARIRR
jgi:hypothetical protein